MTSPPGPLNLTKLLAIAEEYFGSPLPIREIGLLESAAAQPYVTVFGEDAYPSPWDKAAVLLRTIVSNHPLVDGNKRLGWLAATAFLTRVGYSTSHITSSNAVDLVLRVATEHLEIDTTARELRALTLGTENKET